MKNVVWSTARLGDLIEAKYGKALPQAKRRGGDVPVYGSNGLVGWHDASISFGPTIVIGRKGSLGAVNFSQVPCWPIDTTYYIDEPGPFQIEFLDFLLRSLGLTEFDRSTAIPGLNREQLYDIDVPVPPTRDQVELVAILRAVGVRRESAADHLEASQRAIKRFRQVVLAAACSGRLTADWREMHPDTRSVEAALASLATGRKRQPLPDESIALPIQELPESYILGTIRATALLIEYGTSQRSDANIEGVPVLRMGNVQNGSLDLNDLKYCIADREIDKLMLQDGDLLFNRTNSPELVGKTAVFHQDTKMTFASYLIRVRFDPEIADPDFVSYWINSAWGKAWARRVKTDGVSQSNINGTKLGDMPLPLPPIEEQREIVRRASKMLQLADGLLAQVQSSLRCVDRSSQAVLAKAFQGELHTNDANEAAEVL